MRTENKENSQLNINKYATYVDVSKFEKNFIIPDLKTPNTTETTSLHYRFNGHKFWLMVNKSIFNHSPIIVLDNIIEIDNLLFYPDNVDFNKLLYSSEELSMGNHDIDIFIKDTKKEIEVIGMYFQDNFSMINIELRPEECYYDHQNDIINIFIRKQGFQKNDTKISLVVNGLDDSYNELFTLSHLNYLLSNETTKIIELQLNRSYYADRLEINLLSADNSLIGLINKVIIDVKSSKSKLINSNLKKLAEESFKTNKTPNQFTLSTGNWSSGGDGKPYYTNTVGAYKQITMNFSKFWINCTKRPAHGDMNVYVDGKLVTTVHLHVETGHDEANVLVYTSEYLGYGSHTLKLEKPTGSPVNNAAVSINSVDFLTTESFFSLETATTTMDKGTAIALNITRNSFIEHEASITIVSEDSSAHSKINYKPINQIVSFKANEQSKYVAVKAMFYANTLGSLEFKCKLTDPSLGTKIGDISETTVTINSANCTESYFKYTKAKTGSTVTTAGQWDGNGNTGDDETFYPVQDNDPASKTFTFTGYSQILKNFQRHLFS